MKQARENIVEVTYNNAKYLMSLVEKQNDSGIMFNKRIFYLLPTQCVGYISDFNMNDSPDKIIFSNPKTEVKIQSIVNTLLSGNEVTIVFLGTINEKKIENSWLLKFKSSDLAKKWWDKLIKQKKEQIERNTPMKRQTSRRSDKKSKGEKSSTKEKKMLQISKNLDFSEILKKQISFKQIGINANLSRNQIKIQQTQKRQYGTAMSQQFDLDKFNQNARQVPLQKQQQSRIQLKHEQIKHVKEQQTQYNMEKRRLTVKKQQSVHVGNHKDKIQKQANFDGQNIVIQDMQKNSNKRDRNHLEHPSALRRKTNNQIDISIFPQSLIFKSAFKKSNYDILDQSLISVHKVVDYAKLNKQISTKQTPTLLQEVKINNQSNYKSIDSRYFRSYLENNYTLYQKEDKHNKNLPWTFKYIIYNQGVFDQFKMYCKNLLVSLIEDYKKVKQYRLFKPILIKNGIYHYSIDDISIKIALDIKQGIKNKTQQINNIKSNQITAAKFLHTTFNHFNRLYERLDHKSKLKVPLACICEVNGFVGLFKIIARGSSPPENIHEIQSQIKNLSKIFPLNPIFLENAHKYILKLDESYYNSLKRKDDRQITFNYYFIQDIDAIVMPSYITNSINQSIVIPRQELQDPNKYIVHDQKIKLKMEIKEYYSGKSNSQTDILSQILKNNILAAAQQINSLQVYFFSSKQLSNYFHEKGINICFIGFLHDNVNIPFQKHILMAEAASRTCKKMLRKIIQQNIMQDTNLDEERLKNKIQSFLNNILQNPVQNPIIWKQIKRNCLNFYGIDIDLNSMSKRYFLISLIKQCKIDVVWQDIELSLVFKYKCFFNEQNFKGILPQFKIYTPFYNQQYNIACRIIEQQKNQNGFAQLVYYLNLYKAAIPSYFTTIQNEINEYLSYFIDSEKAELQFPHLNLYKNVSTGNPNKILFNLQLIKIKWFLKCNKKEKSTSCYNTLIKTVINYYGEFFPILSQLYDILSSYHFENDNYEETITFAKSSLVNILNLCGINHPKSGQCYFQLGLYYLKVNRLNDAVIQIKKSQNIFENINMTDNTIYALICLKLSYLYLNYGQIQNCLIEGLKSLQIFQFISSPQYEDQITENYEIIYQCYISTNSIKKLNEISQQCFLRLPEIKDQNNLNKMLKIYLYPILSNLSFQNASNYLNIISQFIQSIDKQKFNQSYDLVKTRLQEDSFQNSLLYYLTNIMIFKEQILQTNMLRKWQSFKKIYARQTVQDFVSFTEELIIFLGHEFVTASLQQSLILK